MHAATSDRGGGAGGGSWRLPPDETLQVQDPKDKLDVSEFAIAADAPTFIRSNHASGAR